jgi:hypothetical protein
MLAGAVELVVGADVGALVGGFVFGVLPPPLLPPPPHAARASTATKLAIESERCTFETPLETKLTLPRLTCRNEKSVKKYL